MHRQRGELVSIGEATPQALRHFTRFDQVNQLVSASESDPDLGFMARTMALCSLPRTNPGNRSKYVRRNGPYRGQLRKRKKSYAKRSCSQTGRLQILASKSNRLSDF